MSLARSNIAKGFIARLDKVGAKKATKELASLLVDQRLHGEVEDILVAIEGEYAKKYGVVEANARTAFPLSSEVKQALKKRVQDSTGAKKVILHEEIDTSLLGGVIVSAPDMELDLSLKTKLAKLRA